ncbi:hypothetical protein [uncultured Winogradskyella sp.]|uniref:hypothetical protein n=1 Tax=uncultured Winogradskyella sp. TaxID=395353 RepID=UPI0026376264|nr:hypothetical protein [uncultured Winogradskyella sp.]
MMKEEKNIDRLFQEKFKDFEAAPNDALWNRIDASLSEKKKKRRIVPIWWKVGGVAATLALLVSVGMAMLNSESNTTDEPVIVDTNSNTETTNENRETVPYNKDSTLIEQSKNIKLVNTDNNKEDSTAKPKTSKEQIANSKITVKPKQNASYLKTYVRTDGKANEVLNATTNKSSQKSNIKVTDVASNNKTNAVENKTNSNTLIKNNTSKVAANANDTNRSKDLDEESLGKMKTTTKSSELVVGTNKQSIEDAIVAQETHNEKEDEQNRWSISPNVAPVYFASLGEGSSIHNQFNSNAKGSDINMSYGITGSYTISKKLKIRAGINRVDLNSITSNVLAFNDTALRASTTNTDALGNINFTSGKAVSLISPNVINRVNTPEVFNAKVTGNLEQRFGFIEVPLELQYRLLDRKFGVNVIGGFSTLFLNQNEIYADIDGNTSLIGEANNINATSFSANFGFGFDYNLSKQWNFNLEPQFKYQLNTFNDTFGNFRPFFIGVYTGLSFKF